MKHDAHSNVAQLMQSIGRTARAAARVLALAPTEQKNRALGAAAAALRARRGEILAANDRDMSAAAARQTSAALLDRLRLDDGRVEAMARGIANIEILADPIGKVLAHWSRPNGLGIQRVSVPLGVIGIIYESRPNVTADAGALCLKSSNAVILRGGSESAASSAAIHECLAEGLEAAGLPRTCIQLVPTVDRSAVGHMLADMTDSIDVIVPRGGKELIARVRDEAPRAGDRTSRRSLSRLRRSRRESHDGERDRTQRGRCGAPGFAGPRKRCWWIEPARRRTCRLW